MFRCLLGMLLISAGSARSGELRLLNGDMIRGELEELRGRRVVVRPRWSRNATEVDVRELNYFAMHSEAGGEPVYPEARMWLANGDHLSGRLVEMDEGWVSWETLYGDRVRARRRMVERIERQPERDRVLLRGVLPLSAWEVAQRHGESAALRELNGMLMISPGTNVSLARELPELPERFMLEFELRTDHEAFAYVVGLFAASPHGRGPESLHLNLNQRQIFAQMLGRDHRTQSHWRETLPHHAGERQHIELWVDFLEEKAVMDLNGHRYQEWELPGWESMREGGRRFFTLRSQSGSSTLTLARLGMLEWDGELPPPGAGEDRRGEDRVLLKDGGELEGRVLSLTEGELRMESEEGEVRTLRGDEVRQMLFRGGDRASPRRRNQDVEVYFRGTRDRLTVNMGDLDAEGLEGQSDAWEEGLRIPRSEVGLVRFNIYRHAAAEARGLSIDLDRSFLIRDEEEEK